MTRLRVGRVVLLAVVTFVALIGGTMWLLTTKARPFLTSTIDSTAWPAWLPIATIAALFIVSFVGLQVFRPSLGDRQIFGVRSLPKDPLLTDAALKDVEESETQYIRSIEKLSKIAQPRLEAAATPLLVSYREKLQLLDGAIAELNGQIEQNRYNTHLRRQLLGIYAEKQQTLRDVMKGATS